MEMHSFNFGAEDDSIMEVVSVKILLKQAYSVHVAKVRSLESELRDLKEKLLQSSKSDKTECIQCKHMQEILDSRKQEHAIALLEQKQKLESLAQKLVILENQNMRINADTSAKQDGTKEDPKLLLESSQKKQVLTSVNTNIDLHEEHSVGKRPNQSKPTKANKKVTHSSEAGKGLFETENAGFLCSNGPSTSKRTNSPHSKGKDFFSTVQSSFFDCSNDDSVLVAETLDLLDDVPKKNAGKRKEEKKDSSKRKKQEKESNILKGLLEANIGKENVSAETISLSPAKAAGKGCTRREKQSAKQSLSLTTKRCSSANEKQPKKKCKPINHHETQTTNDKLGSDANLPVQNSPGISFKKVSHGSGTEVNPSCGNLPSMASSSVKATDADIHYTKDDSSNLSMLENLSSFNVDSAFFNVEQSFMQGDSPSLENCDKTSKGSYPAIQVSSHDDDDFQTSVKHVFKKEMNESKAWKTSTKNSSRSLSLKNVKTTSRFKMTLDAPSLNFKKPKYKQTKLSKSIFIPNQSCATDDVISIGEKNVHSTKGEDNELDLQDCNESCEETQKELDVPKETSALDGVTLSFSEMEKLRNVTIDMDVTFVPDFLLQNSNNSVPDILGASSMRKNPPNQTDDSDFLNICLKNDESSLDFVSDLNKQKTSCEQKSRAQTRCEDKKEKCNSFDRVPTPEKPNYKFKENPVRNKDKRQQLKGFDCKECEKYYSAIGLSDQEKQERLKHCSRHRATYVPPATPEHFWELEFPDTEECKLRGYLGDTQKVTLKSRRRRPLK